MVYRACPLESLVINPAFWRDKRVWVTGHTGFKGAWLCLWLQALGARVSGYALSPPTKPSLFELARVAEGMTSTVGDIRDPDALRSALTNAQPQIVFHLAAQSLVRRSYRDPVETYATNVTGTVNVLEAIRQTSGVTAIVAVTSDKCYENRGTSVAYREDDALGGYDPYSSSKACAELVTASYRQSYWQDPAAPALASARAGNVIGGGDWAEDRLVPDALAAFAQGKPLHIRNPAAIRPWQHVLEPLAGYLTLAEKLYAGSAEYRSAWNFGPDARDTKPVTWVVEQLAHAWGNGAKWETDGGNHPHEAVQLMLDCTKARKHLGWRPCLPLDEALRWVVDWHRASLAKANMRETSEAQIAQYQARLP